MDRFTSLPFGMMAATVLLLFVLWWMPNYDINYCKDGKKDICDKNATCRKIPGYKICMCNPGHTGNGTTCKPLSDCKQILDSGITKSDVYPILVEDTPYHVYCDMNTDGGGWIVFQRRGKDNPQTDFNRNFEDYAKGFGNLSKELYMGNDFLHKITNLENFSLRIDIEDFNGNKYVDSYKEFKVGTKSQKYILTLSGRATDITGSAEGDGFSASNGGDFVTGKDTGEIKYLSGYWFKTGKAIKANLNGKYYPKKSLSHFTDDMIFWKVGVVSISDIIQPKKLEMKIRPTA